MAENKDIKEKFKRIAKQFKSLESRLPNKSIQSRETTGDDSDSKNLASNPDDSSKKINSKNQNDTPQQQTEYGQKDSIGQKSPNVQDKNKLDSDTKQSSAQNKNIQAAKTLSKAQQIKQEFESRMADYKESLRQEPIKQRPGESDLAFRRRQQQEEDNSPENIRNRSLSDIASKEAKTRFNKQLNRGRDFTTRKGKEIAAKNPQIAEVSERMKEFEKKRREEIKKLSKKTKEFQRKLNEMRRREAKRLALQAAKRLADAAEKLAQKILVEIGKQLANIVISALAGVSSAFTDVIVPAILIIIVAYVAIESACKANSVFDAVCNTISTVL